MMNQLTIGSPRDSEKAEKWWAREDSNLRPMIMRALIASGLLNSEFVESNWIILVLRVWIKNRLTGLHSFCAFF